MQGYKSNLEMISSSVGTGKVEQVRRNKMGKNIRLQRSKFTKSYKSILHEVGALE